MEKIDILISIERKFRELENSLEVFKAQRNTLTLYDLEAKIHELGLVIEEREE